MEPLRILTENEAFLAIDKPAGLLSIPGRDPSKRSALEILREKYPSLLVVHRIDRETSGVLLFAKTPEFHRQANGWFEHGKMKKTYLALCLGSPFLPVLKIQTPIEGARAMTQVEIKERFKRGASEAFFASVRIDTGKRHQIRIHLAEDGYPLLGDATYGGPKELEGIAFDRTALHARELELPSGEKIQAEIPEDFQKWRDGLRGLS